MINKMREMAPMIMLIILVAFVGGTIFLDWGMNLTSRGGRMMAAGKINGKEIPLTYFDQRVNIARQQMQEGGREVPPQEYRMVPRQIWEQEVNRRLMTDVMKKLRLEASAEEIFDYMKKNPPPGIDTVSFFQTDSAFDTSKYEAFLNDPQNYQQYRWLNEIESYAANTIVPARKLEFLLGAAAVPTRSELEFQYRKKNRKAVFEYMKVNGSDFTQDTGAVTDAMISGYYETHQDSFKIDDQADLYYVKFEKKATEADERFYRDELLELKSRIESSGKPLSEAFAEEAAIETDDPTTAAKGGDLDWFGRGAMVGPFDTVAFSLSPGTISEPVKTSFGLHLIYVEGKEERDGELKVHARHILRKISPTMETLDMLAEKADSMRSAMLEEGFLEAAKAEKSVVFDSTGLFEKGGPLPGIGYLSGAGNFAFGKTDSEVSERLENNEGIYLLSLKRTVKKGILPLQDARDRIRKTLSDSIMIASAKQHLEKIKATLTDSSSLASYRQTDSIVKAGITDTVSGAEYVAQIGYSSPVTAAALSQATGRISPVIEQDGSCYLVKTVWKKEVDSIPPADSPEMQQIALQLRQQTAQNLYMQWYLSHKNNAKIVSNIDKIYLD